MGLLVILLVAMVDFVVGAFMGPKSTEEIARGWVGLNGTSLEIMIRTTVQPKH